MKKNILSILIISLLLFATSCHSSSKEKSKKTLDIAFVDGWAEGVAMTHVAKYILEENDYKVNMKQASVDLVFASLANGDLDVFMDVWLPVTHKEKLKRIEGKVEPLGVNFDHGRIGLVVPTYVTINSIEELNANVSKFDNRIVGIEKGAGITAKTNLVIKKYGLNLDQLNSSGVAMLTELQKAISEKRWIVVTGWQPHWKFGRYDLKFLEDPKGIYGSSETVETYARIGFKEYDTFAANFFSKFHLSQDQMSDLLVKMEDGKDKDAIAKQWVEDNKELVNSWLAK